MDEFEEFEKGSVLIKTGHIAVQLRDGRILVWGGYKDNDSGSRYCSTSLLWLFDPHLEKWRYSVSGGDDNIPPGTSGAGGLILGTHFYILGGYCDETNHTFGGGNTNEVYRLDLASRMWQHLNVEGKRPLPVDKFSVWSHGENIYIFGGFGLNPASKSHLYNTENVEFEPDDNSSAEYPRGWNNQFAAFNTTTNCWYWPSYKGRKPIARAAHACAKLGNSIYICGGRHRNVRMNDIHRLNMETMHWSGVLPVSEPIPHGRSWHSLTAVSETKLVLYGGLGHNQEPLNDCWMFDASLLFWCRLQRHGLQPRLWHTANHSSDGEIVILGGCTNNIQRHSAQYATELLLINISPKSLLRICLDAVVQYKIPTNDCLPQELKMILLSKSNVQEPI